MNTYSQQKIYIDAKLDLNLQQITVNQTITLKNNSNSLLNEIILNDWNNAYSSKSSSLGKRLSDEYVRNFHLSSDNSKGYTSIQSIKVNNTNSEWTRNKNQIDIINLSLENSLKPNDSLQIELKYIIKVPDAKFTKIGHYKESTYLKDCFITLSKRNSKNEFLSYSNENLDDICNEKINKISFKLETTSNSYITSNLENVDTNNNTHYFEGSNLDNIVFLIEKSSTIEDYNLKNNIITTNLFDYKISKSSKFSIIEKIVDFTNENIGLSKNKRIFISNIDYERNPFYGLNQLPSFISPFSNDFLFEIIFLKAYTQTFLKENLNIDFRKDHFLFDAIQMFLINKYIDQYYPDLHLIGNLRKIKLGKGYEISKAKFNNQFLLYYYLMARKNLDQNVTESKEKLIRFNEKISVKNKAGQFLIYLDNYLKNNSINNSIIDFYNNQDTITTTENFIRIIEKNSQQNLNWFSNLISSKEVPDFSFGKISNSKKSIEVKNKFKSNIPFSISGFNKKEKVFEKFYITNQKDTIIDFEQKFDKLILNYQNSFPEINNRNNFKSTKNIINRPLKFIFFRDIENPYYSQVFYVPEIGFNIYDGAIISMNLNNKSLIEKPFLFVFSPSYSTTARNLTGSTVLSYTQQFYNKDLYQIRYTLSGSYFHYIENAAYKRITPAIAFRFRNNDDLRDNFRQNISLRQVIVNKDYSAENKSTDPLNFSIFDARYNISDSETAKSYGIGFNYQLASNFSKFITEFGYRKLFENNFQINSRFYFGTFINNKTNSSFYDFGLDRPKDYFFDYNYYGRSETSGLFSQQIIIAEGGFKSKFINPYANQWIVSTNVAASIWKYVFLYGDAGFYKNKFEKSKFVYDSGIQVSLLPDYFELFFPLYSSSGFEPSQKSYQEKIRFVVTLSPNTLFKLFTRKWF